MCGVDVIFDQSVCVVCMSEEDVFVFYSNRTVINGHGPPNRSNPSSYVR